MSNSTLKILLCDDDVQILNILKQAVSSIFHSHQVETSITTASTKMDCINALNNNNYQLLLMDIDMPGCDGIDLVSEIQAIHPTITVIFVSSREDRVFDSFKVHPFGFVRKSNFTEDFTHLVSSYLEKQETTPSKDLIIIKNGALNISVPNSDLLYIEGKNKYQILHLNNGKQIQVRSTLDTLEKELVDFGYLRIHKGFLVNISYIQVIGDTNVLLTNKESLPLSRKKANEILKEYMRLLQKTNKVLYIHP